MKINNINNQIVSTKTMSTKKEKNCSQPQKVSFGGVSNISLKTMDFIARGGLCASFCIQDGLGMILPRIVQGFFRNKDITGEYNYGEAAEVAIREILTGPPMFLIPMVIIAGCKNYIGKACDVPVEFIKGLGAAFKTSTTSDCEINSKNLKEHFYTETMKNILNQASNGELNEDTLNNEASKFVTALQDIEESKSKTLKQKIMNTPAPESADDKLAKLKNEFIRIRKNHSNNPSEIASNVTLHVKNENISCSFDSFVTHLRNFTDDAIKYTKKNGLDQENIKTFVKKRVFARNAAILGMLGAVIGFCYKIPDLYKLHEVNPGLNGLVDENGKKRDIHNVTLANASAAEIMSPFSAKSPNYFWMSTKEVQ